MFGGKKITPTIRIMPTAGMSKHFQYWDTLLKIRVCVCAAVIRYRYIDWQVVKPYWQTSLAFFQIITLKFSPFHSISQMAHTPVPGGRRNWTPWPIQCWVYHLVAYLKIATVSKNKGLWQTGGQDPSKQVGFQL